MTSVVDAHPYPFSEPDGQRLHLALCQLHPSGQRCLLLAKEAGLDGGMINPDQAPMLVWMEALEAAATAGATRVLVARALERLAPASPFRPFFERLLANRPVAISGEPRSPEGAPNFLEGSDEIGDPEALLYYDDLTIPIGRVPALIGTLQKLVAVAPSVCRLLVDFNGVGFGRGTAFRIGGDLLLTNWHVLELKDGTRATTVTAEFGYEDDGAGGLRATTNVPCEIQSIVTNKTDDWGVICVRDPASMLAEWPILSLANAGTPQVNSPAFVLQHPQGELKRLGFVRNQVTKFDDRVVHYLTDTQVGSSGAPVLDPQGRLLALHHAGGRPQEVVGKPPLKKNEGIRIPLIMDGLSKAHVAFG